MMDEVETDTYARGIAAALRIIGPTPRPKVLGMLYGLHLSEAEAENVITHALARRLLVRESEDLQAQSER
jgi:hypothetical protein